MQWHGQEKIVVAMTAWGGNCSASGSSHQGDDTELFCKMLQKTHKTTTVRIIGYQNKNNSFFFKERGCDPPVTLLFTSKSNNTFLNTFYFVSVFF